ncbi:MAG: hypothetical protein ABIR94_07350 [Rubrivivax sp.]
MNIIPHAVFRRRAWSAATICMLLAGTPAMAAPGAHGPGGEHLDAPVTGSAGSSRPRVEAQSEAFELVADLRPAEMVILVDRYATNEPVLGARLEVESGALKAAATYRAEQGDYVVTDAALLEVLARPGEHALVFTLVAGAEADLLDGTLLSRGKGVAASASGHGHGPGAVDHGHEHGLERAAWIGGGVFALGLFSGTLWWRQRRREGTRTRQVTP